MLPTTMVYRHKQSGRYSIWSQCPAGTSRCSWGDPWPVEETPTDERLRQVIDNDLDQFLYRVEKAPSPEFRLREGGDEFGREYLGVSVTRSADSYLFTPFIRHPSGATISEPSLALSVDRTALAAAFAHTLRECFDSI